MNPSSVDYADRSCHRPHRPQHLARHPLAVALFMLGQPDRLHGLFLADVARHLGCYSAELHGTVLDELRQPMPVLSTTPNQPAAGNSVSTTLGKALYYFVRATRPASLVETGVAHGNSTWILLNALKRNGNGHLYSIDLPDRDSRREYDVASRPAGWLVPQELKHDWTFLRGPAQDLLPDLLTSLESIDFFFHDSDHSAAHMRFEFEAALPRLVRGSLLLADDVGLNTVFHDFVGRHRLTHCCLRKGGIARKG